MGMYMRYSPDQLSTIISEISTLAERFEGELMEVKQFSEILHEWQSEENICFTEQILDCLNSCKRMVTVLREYESFLNGVKDAYTQAEDRFISNFLG